MNEHRYATTGKIGPFKRSKYTWDEIVGQIAHHGIAKIKDVSYANSEPVKGKLTKKLDRLELLKLWRAVEVLKRKNQIQ